MVNTRKARQLSLALRERREGAGRTPGPSPSVRHRSRPRLSAHYPCHVTLRVRSGVPSLRNVRFVRAFEETLARGCDRGEFRLVHYALLGNHAHLIVEAKDRHALGRGMKSVTMRIVRAAERAFAWSGRVLADRYHMRILKTPREVRNAIRYVLLNARRHASRSSRGAGIDPASSGRWFDGWKKGTAPGDDGIGAQVVAAAHTWLLRTGWRRHGLLDPLDVPGGARASP